MAVLKQIKVGKSISEIQFTEVKPANGGVITATPSHTDSADEKNPEYAIDLTIANDGTLVKENKALKVGTVPAAQVSVADEAGVFTAENVETVLKELKDGINAVGGAAKSYTIVKNTKGLATNIKEQYKLQETVGGKTVPVGEPINIYKDSSLSSVALDGQTLNFTYILTDGSESTVGVDVSTFLAESEFADGLYVTNHIVSVKIDPTSENFLTVGKDGVKLAGVQNAINTAVSTAVEGLDFGGTVEAGQYVSSVSETNGIVSTTKANVSDAVLNGYAKGEKPTSTAIADTDDVKGALAKLEHQVDAAKAAATTKVAKDNAASHLTLASSTAADGSTTYTIGESDIASKTALDAEIDARKAVDGQDGQTYAANSGTNYISVATSLNDADVKLDAALKAEADRAKSAEKEIADKVGLTGAEGSRTFATTQNYGTGSTSVVNNMQKLDAKLKEVADGLAAVQYKVTGTTLEFFGISPKTV